MFTDRAADVISQVNLARQRREAQLAGEIRQRMLDETEQLQEFLLVTRIAIARATDQLAQLSDSSLLTDGVVQ